MIVRTLPLKQGLKHLHTMLDYEQETYYTDASIKTRIETIY